MANIYTWIIDSLDVTPSIDGQTNFVSCIHYRLKSSDGLEPTPHTAMIWGTQALTYTTGNPFIAYSNLTESTVVDWLKTSIGEPQILEMQATLDTQIENIINPPVANLPLPW